MNRQDLASLIVDRLSREAHALEAAWAASGPIHHFEVDDLLPATTAHAIRTAFPDSGAMTLKRSLRELKFVSAQMNRYDRLLEESVYAFQDSRVVDQIARITDLRSLEPDVQLYAGGISTMVRDHFLNPHVDNSHDKSRQRYRVLNLLYYVSPNWEDSKGGHLELWPDGPGGEPITIASRFNRLVVMLTNRTSWHSVSPVRVDESRCCVSNYYFSTESPEASDYFHVTSFRGRPDQRLRDVVLRADVALRAGLRRLFPKGITENKHFYDREPPDA